MARGDGTPAVLKPGVPSETALAEEASALAPLDGRGAILRDCAVAATARRH
ncbi:MAG: hypothetical protein IRY90_11755 [Actinomadura rubrobrunea]|nr:hypothetical protein [Actinomadura rubrobrunea]